MRDYRFLLLAALILLFTGVGLNAWRGISESLTLVEGSEVIAGKLQDGSLVVALDSITIGDHVPSYVIGLRLRDSSVHHQGSRSLVSTLKTGFPLDEMVIRKIPDTDYRFRLRTFYPNFSFDYTYPVLSDSIEPVAPGVVLRLNTAQGDPVITLRADRSGQEALDDIAGLGARLVFYWESPPALEHPSGNDTICFIAGRQRTVTWVSGRDTISRPLIEQQFYPMPHMESTGFTVLLLCPDVSLITAVPVSKNDSLRNPVAQIDVWRLNQGYAEVFLYRDPKGTRGGQYQVPGSPWILSLEPDARHTAQFCQATISLHHRGKDTPVHAVIGSHARVRLNGYSLRLEGCTAAIPYGATMLIEKKPGRRWVQMALVLLGIALIRAVFVSLKLTV